jgi:hypothetical protein
VNVVAHDAQPIELKSILILRFLDSVNQHLAALDAGEAEFSIIAASRDVIGISWL